MRTRSREAEHRSNRAVFEKHEGALKLANVSTKQERIAELARENPAMAFTSLNHYLDLEWLEYAFECTRKDGAVGVDGQTAESYAANLRQNLTSLIERLKSGRYRALRVARSGDFSLGARHADGSDRDSVGAWPEKHLLGTQLGPNRNGKKW